MQLVHIEEVWQEQAQNRCSPAIAMAISLAVPATNLSRTRQRGRCATEGC
jgi:hypothetical protein